MSNDNIHYDYCRCCGIWTKLKALDMELVCTHCFEKYGSNWPRNIESRKNANNTIHNNK